MTHPRFVSKLLVATLSGLLIPLAALPAASGSDALRLAWGTGPGKAGYVNRTTPDYVDPADLGPQGVALAAQGQILVADTLNDRVLVFDAASTLRETVTGDFKRPRAVASNAAGELLVADGTKPLVYWLDSGRKTRLVLGSQGQTKDRFGQIDQLRIDAAGNVVCADLAESKLWVVRRDGGLVTALDWEGNGLAFDSRGRFCDLAFDESAGYWLRARTLVGQAEKLASLPFSPRLEGVKLLGLDKAGRMLVRCTPPDARRRMLVLKMGPGGRTFEKLGTLRHFVAADPIAFDGVGRLVWLDYDASAAPKGDVRILRYDLGGK